ncbi:MAG: hypothetical protein R3357_10645 [Burkholderiales bacterium]|nr:hypothetical protein [Burkholderiales bacterium]
MNPTTPELKRLVLPVLAFAVLVGAGVALIWWSQQLLVGAKQQLAVVSAERAQNTQRLLRIADEEREVKEKIAVYRRLKDLGILGRERRLEWADAMTRIRSQRSLIDLRYRVEPQRPLASVPGNPGTVDFYASTMKVRLALLHEEDLFGFLNDLRSSGNAYYSVKRCALGRSGVPPTAPNLAARVNAECDIDLITIVDQGAKS